MVHTHVQAFIGAKVLFALLTEQRAIYQTHFLCVRLFIHALAAPLTASPMNVRINLRELKYASYGCRAQQIGQKAIRATIRQRSLVYFPVRILSEMGNSSAPKLGARCICLRALCIPDCKRLRAPETWTVFFPDTCHSAAYRIRLVAFIWCPIYCAHACYISGKAQNRIETTAMRIMCHASRFKSVWAINS